MEIKPLIYTLRAIKKPSKRYVEGEHEVRIRLSQGKEKEFISLGYSSSVENWDSANDLPKPSHPYYKELSKKIQKIIDDIEFELKLAERARKYISCIEIKRKALHQDIDQPSQGSQLKILEYFDKVISELEEAGKPGYADVFDATRSTVSKLLNNNQFISACERSKEIDKPFLAFTKADHQRYERQISAGTSQSTISLYLRTYYRIWNLAIKDGYCTREEHHPSKFINFRAYKRIRTKKRSINKDYLGEIMELKFDPGSRQFRSHLMLQFMYYARGINFGDLCKLKRTDVANGTINYTRSKNHRPYDYTLHPKAQEVVDYFRNCPVQSDAGYLFPILFSQHNTARKVDTRIHDTIGKFNEDLDAMAVAVGWERKFTSNSIRHGFATHLRNAKVDISFIKEAMGHETDEQTSVYLDDLDDQSIAEEINRALNFNADNKKRNLKKKGPKL